MRRYVSVACLLSFSEQKQLLGYCPCIRVLSLSSMLLNLLLRHAVCALFVMWVLCMHAYPRLRVFRLYHTHLVASMSIDAENVLDLKRVAVVRDRVCVGHILVNQRPFLLCTSVCICANTVT